MSWTLPQSVAVGGVEYAVHTDYRDILLVMEQLNLDDAQQGILNALYIFFEDFEAVPPGQLEQAYRAMCDFIRCGADEDEGATAVKLLDWEQDSSMIVADVNKVAGCEVRALDYLHWFTFMGFFSAVGEGQLSSIVSIRSKRAKGKKLEKWEQEFYRENRARIDFKKAYTGRDQQEKDALLRLLGE